jgi:ATP-binding cassette, subfamily B, bacterial PglK
VVFQSNFEVLHPSWVAVVGASGSGKSTLVELLCGIQAPQVGRVVHGWPDGTAPKVAYLPQHVALLDSTIAQNVIFGFDEGDTTRVDEALALACLDELAASRVNGCDAPAGADGALLSGGERQRLALARALYRNPDLLLIDEGTSGLDELTEARLFARLRKQRPDMSVIYVTHRSCSLHFADKVVRLQGGTLVEIPGSWPNHE